MRIAGRIKNHLWWYWEIYLLILGVVVGIGLLGLLTVEIYKNDTMQEGVVINKFYEGRSSSMGNVIDSKGNVGIVTSSKAERYTIIVDGVNLKGKRKVGSVSMKPEYWVNISEGDKFDRNTYKK